MEGKIENGVCVVRFDPWNGDRLLSPDGDKHLLLCDRCYSAAWYHLHVIATLCETCIAATKKKEER